jgi:WD40 repeat protein
MDRLFRIGLAIAALIAFSGAASAHRIAFVVGIDDYDHLPRLQKAVGDARAVKAVLEDQGNVTVAAYLENPTREAFWTAWDAFLERVAEGNEAIVHISSHGIEIDGANYLLPRDAPPATKGRRIVTQDAIRFDELLASLSRRGPLVSLFILDACRNNPYAAEGTRALGSARGLGRVAPPRGSFILYAAGYNELALDRLSDQDPVSTSVFVRNLLPLLRQPGLTIQDLALQVADQVHKEAAAANHDQNPAYFDNLLRGRGRYCFAGCAPSSPDPGAIHYEDKAMRLVRTYPGQLPTLVGAAFVGNSDKAVLYGCGQLGVVGCAKGTMRIIDVPGGSLVRTIDAHATDTISFSAAAHSNLAVSGSCSQAFIEDGIFDCWRGELKLWDLETGGLVKTLPELAIRKNGGHSDEDWVAVALSPDARRVVSASCRKGQDSHLCVRGVMTLWDVASGASIENFDLDLLLANSAVFSPDGRIVAVGGCTKSDESGTGGQPCGVGGVEIWDLSARRRLHKLVLPSGSSSIFALAFARAGEHVIAASCVVEGRTFHHHCGQGHVDIWNSATGRLVRRLPAQPAGTYSVSFSSHGRVLAAGGCDELDRSSQDSNDCAAGSIVLYDAASGGVIFTLKTPGGRVGSLAFSRDDKFLLSAGKDGKARLWDVSEWTSASPGK